MNKVSLAAIVAALLSATALAGDWIPIGPTDAGIVMRMATGLSGVYAATCNGVYRSDDAGASWREAGLQRQLCVFEVAADPHSDTVYAVVDSGDFVSQYPEPSIVTFDLHLGSRLWVSRDAGKTWSQTSLTTVMAVVVDPADPATAYAATYGELFPLAVTHDFGASWSVVPAVPDDIILRLAIDARDEAIYGVAEGGLLVVGSPGSWSEFAIGDNSGDGVLAVAAGSGTDGAVYAVSSKKFCVRKTLDPIWACSAFPGFGASILEVPESVSEPRRILVAGHEVVWSSDDGGSSWTSVPDGPAGDTVTLTLDPSGIILAGSDVGVYRSTDRGKTWTNASAGLRSAWVRAVALDPTDPSTIWAGAEGRDYHQAWSTPGLFRSTDGGATWASVSVKGEPGYVFSLGLDPTDPRNVYAGSFGSVTRTQDGGASWSSNNPTNEFVFGVVFGIAVDPTSSSTVWAATQKGLKKSSDKGQTWSDTRITKSIFSLLFDSKKPETVYLGENFQEGDLYYYPFGTGFAVSASHDGGSTWQIASSTDFGAVTALATDPFSPDVVYAGTYTGDILRSSDAGATWTSWNTQGPGTTIFTLVADPVRSGRLYLGGWFTMARSVDGGRTWHTFADGLSPHGVLGLAVSPDGRWLYAATTGGGVFRRDLATADLPVDRATPAAVVARSRATRSVPPRAAPEGVSGRARGPSP